MFKNYLYSIGPCAPPPKKKRQQQNETKNIWRNNYTKNINMNNEPDSLTSRHKSK